MKKAALSAKYEKQGKRALWRMKVFAGDESTMSLAVNSSRISLLFAVSPCF